MNRNCILLCCLLMLGSCKNNPVPPPTEKPPREFLIPRSVGTTWTYQYADYSVDADRWQTTTWGYHTWIIVSSDSAEGGMVIHVADLWADSIYKHDIYSLLPDSSRRRVDSLTFDILVRSDSIRFCCPELQPGFQCIGRFLPESSDTLSIRQSYPCDVTTVYVHQVGLVGYSYHYYHVQAHHDQVTSMTLRDFVVP